MSRLSLGWYLHVVCASYGVVLATASVETVLIGVACAHLDSGGWYEPFMFCYSCAHGYPFLCKSDVLRIYYQCHAHATWGLGRGGGGRPPPPRVLRDSGGGVTAPTAPKIFYMVRCWGTSNRKQKHHNWFVPLTPCGRPPLRPLLSKNFGLTCV